MGEIVLALLHPDPDRARQILQVHARHQVEGPAEEDADRASCTAPATTRSSSPMKTACAPTTPRSRSRASSPISTAATARPRANGRARNWRSIFPTCPARAASGYRLKPEALCVKIGGKHIGEISRTVGAPRRRMVRDRAEGAQRAAERDRRARAEGNPRAAVVPARRRPQLPDAGARLRHAVRRREPAHPPGVADRLGPDRRALCAGRALDRPAPARQCAAAGNAEAAARPRQHRDRGRA